MYRSRIVSMRSVHYKTAEGVEPFCGGLGAFCGIPIFNRILNSPRQYTGRFSISTAALAGVADFVDHTEKVQSSHMLDYVTEFLSSS